MTGEGQQRSVAGFFRRARSAEPTRFVPLAMREEVESILRLEDEPAPFRFTVGSFEGRPVYFARRAQAWAGDADRVALDVLAYAADERIWGVSTSIERELL